MIGFSPRFEDNRNTREIDVMELTGVQVFAVLFTISRNNGKSINVFKEIGRDQNVWDVVLDANVQCTEAYDKHKVKIWVERTAYVANSPKYQGIINIALGKDNATSVRNNGSEVHEGMVSPTPRSLR